MPLLSILDLAPVPEGSDAAAALRNTLNLARHAERLGYRRFWLAEHHNMPGIASAATAVVIAHVAAGTAAIRVGAGGIMLPNHAPLMVAESFGTLAALHPGRIDLGLGRAPGTDMATARALRRTLAGDVDQFPQDVVELLQYFRTDPAARVRAIPGEGADVEVWMLGSSLFGAELAATLGLPYAFASHFAPGLMEEAIEVYRSTYRPSERWPRSHLMLALNVFAADTEQEARRLFTSLQQAFVNLRTGKPGKLPPPVDDFGEGLDDRILFTLDQALACTVVGDPGTVRKGIADFAARTGADELMLTGQIFDHHARLRSFTIAAEAMRAA
jgi:luciferase family oxidoreductase group 1